MNPLAGTARSPRPPSPGGRFRPPGGSLEADGDSGTGIAVIHGRRCVASSTPGALARHETTDGDHGRIEIRRAFVSHDVAWLASERRFPDLAAIGVI